MKKGEGNPVVRVIENRRSVRAFKDKPVETEKIKAILQAGMRSPTAGNLMLYSIINVTDQTIKERLSVTCDNQPFIAASPLVLLFLADYQRLFDFFQASDAEDTCRKQGGTPRKPREGDLFLAICDAVIAAQTTVLAAESLGLGSCYIGDIMENYEIHKELFDLPDFVFPITLVCYGYPKGKTGKGGLSPRLNEEYVVFENRYCRFDREKILAMMKPLEDKYFSNTLFPEGISNIGQYFYNKKFVSDFSLEMNRSVRQALSTWLK